MSSSSSSSSSPEPPSPTLKKRKRKDVTIPEADASDNSDAESIPDEPALSHAERRRQKKAEKRKQKEKEQPSSSASKKRKLENGKAVPVPAEKRKNSVWVGNLSFKTTQENLREFFKGVGEITRLNMPTRPGANPAMKPENRGFAYVDFATPEAKIAAIALSEQPLIGRKLLIKDGDDFTGRPAKADADAPAPGAVTHSKTAQKILNAQKQPPAPTLFLGNLGFETTEQDIKQLLEAHRVVKKKAKKEDDTAPAEGDTKDEPKDVWIRKVRMGTFEDSGLCKGFAFVDFTSTEHATAALINPKNYQLNGRKLVVEYASADAVRRGAPKGKREDGSTAPPKKRDAPPHSKRSERPDRKPRRDEFSSRPHEKAANEDAEATPASAAAEESAKKRSYDAKRTTSAGEGRREKGPKSRPKPGAALALAKRESAAIVPSKGKKITF
ncbi:putative RNA recognition motif containing protein [Lyophyllum shimeji]|uniref:RNA recognition motif containing protein n=1 Tax=Lyophyllum shimeji TaxID=47721 RepID=A0A9P3PDX2_LYOSH|nr:putative RNA recognition motif containing protein [Lyophyllum shimeji]